MSISTVLFILAFVSLGTLGGDNELRIHDTSELITFLNDESDYTDTTVYLESDLDFSKSLSNEVGPKSSFKGIFDGQGHTINNLMIKSSSTTMIGLFSYITGSIRNIIIRFHMFFHFQLHRK